MSLWLHDEFQQVSSGCGFWGWVLGAGATKVGRSMGLVTVVPRLKL